MAKSKKAAENTAVKKTATKKAATKKSVAKKAAKKASPKKAAAKKTAQTAAPELPEIMADIPPPITTENNAIAIDTNAPFFMIKIGDKFCCMERRGTHAIEHASFFKESKCIFHMKNAHNIIV